MKRLMIVLAVLFVFSASAYAQMGMTGGATSGEQKGEMKPCGMMMSEEQQMPMCQQMMMGQNMMMKDMMQMMTEMLKIQQKMMRGLSPLEKKEIAKELETMIRNMDKMMSEMRGMVMQGVKVPAAMEPKKDEEKKDAPTHEGAPKNGPHKH